MKTLLCLLAFSTATSAIRIPWHQLVDQSHREPEPTSQISPPTVKLPYEIHQAISNETGNYYNFSNIPYAQPPLDKLRFAKPEVITTESDDLNDGTIGRICPQDQPTWVGSALFFIVSWTLGWFEEVDVAHMKVRSLLNTQQDPRTSEDCLLLDVVVPKKVWEDKDGKEFPPVPVMVWIHGGGFIFGDKNQFGRPTGLFNASRYEDGKPDENAEGIIYVTMNYRLGAFGWLTSPEFIKEGGASNAGLLDQLAALQWIKQYIHLFNGDPERVTVFGQSAGASSILHHLTSYGGPQLGRKYGPPPFLRAILQSPAFFPQVDDKKEQSIYSNLLKLTNSYSLEDLRNTDSRVLQFASNFMIQTAKYGQFTFGPAVDDLLVPAPLSILLDKGFYWPKYQVMVADNGNEGLLFSPPTVQSDSSFRSLISQRLPGLTPEGLEEVVKMYPTDDSFTPKQRVQRVANAISELAVLCNTQYVLKAYGGPYRNAYNYKFGVYPGFHGQDAFFTYYEHPFANEQKGAGNFSKVTAGTEGTALSLQGYLTSFAKYGDPNVAGLGPEWLPSEDGFLNITSTNGPGGPIDQIGNITFVEGYESYSDLKKRCDWWKEAPYWNPDDDDLKDEL